MSQKKDKAEAEVEQKPQLFTEDEVKFAIVQTVAFSLHSITNLLLDSGAAPSGEIGKIIMGLSAGAVNKKALTQQALEKLAAEPKGVERINILQELIREQAQ